MPRYLVTGGAGFIGSHIVEALTSRGDQVRVIDDLSSGLAANIGGLGSGALGRRAPVELLQASITSDSDCAAACAGVEAVFHEAAMVSVPRSFEEPQRCYDVNTNGTLRLLDAAKKAGVRTFVFASSSAVYGDSPKLPKEEGMWPAPMSPYASSKLASEQLLEVWGRAHGMRTVSLRYFNVFGPRQRDDSPYTGVIALFARALLEGRPATILGDGEQTRDFTFVENVVHANLLASERDLAPGEAINLGSGDRVSINTLHSAIAEILGTDLAPVHAPPRQGDVRDSLASLERARTRLGYAPRVRFEVGLEKTLAWYRDRLVGGRR